MDSFRIWSESLSKLRKGNHDEGSDGLINLARMDQQNPCIFPSCVLREFPLRSIHTIFAIDTLDDSQLPEKVISLSVENMVCQISISYRLVCFNCVYI